MPVRPLTRLALLFPLLFMLSFPSSSHATQATTTTEATYNTFKEMIDPVVAKLKEVSAPLLAKIKTPPFKKTGDLKETVDSWMEYFEADVARSASTFDEYPELDFTPIGKAMLDKAKGLAPVPLQDKCKFQATMADLECAKASIVNLCIAIANVETTATAEEVFPHMAGTPINAPPQSFVSLRERTRGRRRSPPAEALGPIEPPTGPETEESIRERKNIPKWVLEKLGEPDAEGVYTVRHEPTILSQVVYFKQDSTSVWMWSFDKESWDSVSINVASRGKQVGQGLVGQGLDLLEALFKAEGGVVQPRSASFSFSNADAVPGAVHNCISHDSTGHAEPVLFIHGVTGTFGLSAASLETVVDIRRKRVKHYVVDRLVGGVDPLPSGITAYCGVAWKSPLPLKSPLIANKYHAWLNQAQGDGTVGSVPLAGMYGFATKNKPTAFDGSLPICKGLVSYQFPISKSKVPFAWHGHPSLRRPLMPGVDCSTKQHPMSCLAFWLFSSSLMPWGLKGGVAPGLMLLAISNADV